MTLPAAPAWIGDWTVGTRLVRVDGATGVGERHGAISQGAVVYVECDALADGSCAARLIDVRQSAPRGCRAISFEGIVERLPEDGLGGVWTVSGMTVRVHASAAVDESQAGVARGVAVSVDGDVQPDGSVSASTIETRAGGCGEPGAPPTTAVAAAIVPVAASPEGSSGVLIRVREALADGTDREELRVVVGSLRPRSIYGVTINEQHVGTVMTDGAGDGQLLLSRATPPGMRPVRGAPGPAGGPLRVEVLEPGGHVIARGELESPT